MQNFLLRLLPFLFLGVMTVIFICGLIIFSYLLIFGAILGFVFFILAWFKERFFPNRHLTKTHKPGRTLDQ